MSGIIRALTKKNESMRNRLEHFVTIDEDTQMNNLLAYERCQSLHAYF